MVLVQSLVGVDPVRALVAKSSQRARLKSIGIFFFAIACFGTNMNFHVVADVNICNFVGQTLGIAPSWMVLAKGSAQMRQLVTQTIHAPFHHFVYFRTIVRALAMFFVGIDQLLLVIGGGGHVADLTTHKVIPHGHN